MRPYPTPADRTLELGLIVGAGLAVVVAELAGGGKTAVIAVAAAAWLAYLLSRWRRRPWRAWGIGGVPARAITSVTALTLLVLAPILAFGLGAGRLPPPRGFWLILPLYLPWGVAQQFLLNAILARNLGALLGDRAALALAPTLFALAHLPDVAVAALTFPAGLLWTWAFRRWPSIWLLGVSHALLGAATFYLLLGRDPAAALAP